MKSVLLAGLLSQAQAGILFQDSFDRADSRNIDATLTGITDNTGSNLLADAVYTQPWIDPNSGPPNYGVQDSNAANGGGTQVLANQLQLKVGPGTVNAFINHNFINPEILAEGGFSVDLDVNSYAETSAGQGAAFGVGLSAAEAASLRDANATNLPHLSNAFGAGFPTQINAAADFWLAIRGNKTLIWGHRDTTLGSNSVPAKTGKLTARFAVPNFKAGTTVAFEVFHNDISLGTGSFVWSHADSNHIALDGRDNTSLNLDNLKIATHFVQPVVTQPVTKAFEATRRSGPLNTRFHWSVTDGTGGEPLSVVIRNDDTTIYTSSSPNGFADVNTTTNGPFTLTASNSAGESMFETTLATEDALSNAIRADAPVAWYRFNDSSSSPLIADSSDSAVPHEASPAGGLELTSDSPRDGVARFFSNGSILTDAILNPASVSPGYTIEAVVQRLPTTAANAALVSQIDGSGIGRTHLAVNNDGTIQTFLAGGPAQRKDADVSLPSTTWAHLVMVVDAVSKEIRWYLDGVLIGSSADGANPDGSTFNSDITLESATGAWRIGTQKLADQNFWKGDIDEVAIYDHLLDDPNADDDHSDSRVAPHASAWRASAAGLLGFYAAAESITAGGETTLTIKVGADVTSVLIEPEPGTVTPVNGLVSVTVRPTETTTYSVTVEGSKGPQTWYVTITVTAPAVPPVITSSAVEGVNYRITFTGSPTTPYKVLGSLDLNTFTIDHGTFDTDANGLGNASIPIIPEEKQHFYRVEGSP